MRPWRFATDNVLFVAPRRGLVFRFNEAVAFCHG